MRRDVPQFLQVAALLDIFCEATQSFYPLTDVLQVHDHMNILQQNTLGMKIS